MRRKFLRSGQALVVILMTLAVATAVGLTIITRTTSEVSLSTTQEESATALSAAEAGIDAYLGNIASQGVPTNVGQSATFEVISATPDSSSNIVSFPQELKSGEAVTVFLNGNLSASPVQPLTQIPPTSPYNGNLRVCWGDQDKTTQTPALELLVYYYNSGSVPPGFSTAIVTFDPLGRSPGFTSTPPSGVGYQTNPPSAQCPTGKNYRYALIGLTKDSFGIGSNNWVLMRVKMLHNDTESHPVAVRGSAQFPSQGETVLVEGKSGNTVRKIQFTRSYPDPLPIFDNTLFSGGNL